MTIDPFNIELPFITRSRKQMISVIPLAYQDFDKILDKLSDRIKDKAIYQGFTSGSGKILFDDKKAEVYFAVPKAETPFDYAKLYQALKSLFSEDYLSDCGFELKDSLDKNSLYNFYLGWGMAHYSFKISDDIKDSKKCPTLLWHKNCDKEKVSAVLHSIYLLRNLINIPTVSMGPDELEAAIRAVGSSFHAKVKVIKGKELESGFPLVHAVGMSSHRAPRLIELHWGKKSDPKICLVGKGVCFDTGGLDLKPSQFMRYMKKDMGGAAHALALAQVIMALQMPLQIQLLIPAVENAVAAESFRPGDVFKSRKGLTVENTNTDAEGRLILADSLTYGCESNPELIIDFATLTGSARAALGQDIPAMFSNRDDIASELQESSMKAHDPLWAMPLWDGYGSLIESSVADLHNSAGVPGDLIYSALFLQKFLKEDTPWVHIDTFAWESNGRPGRAKGAMDLGLRSVLSYLQVRYGQK